MSVDLKSKDCYDRRKKERIIIYKVLTFSDSKKSSGVIFRVLSQKGVELGYMCITIGL